MLKFEGTERTEVIEALGQGQGTALPASEGWLVFSREVYARGLDRYVVKYYNSDTERGGKGRVLRPPVTP